MHGFSFKWSLLITELGERFNLWLFPVKFLSCGKMERCLIWWRIVLLLLTFSSNWYIELTLQIRFSEKIYSHTSSTTIYRKILQTKLFSVLSGTMQKSKQCIERYLSNNNNDYNTEYDSRLEGDNKINDCNKRFLSHTL